MSFFSCLRPPLRERASSNLCAARGMAGLDFAALMLEKKRRKPVDFNC